MNYGTDSAGRYGLLRQTGTPYSTTTLEDAQLIARRYRGKVIQLSDGSYRVSPLHYRPTEHIGCDGGPCACGWGTVVYESGGLWGA